jgi:large subunit ribosomal protein L49
MAPLFCRAPFSGRSLLSLCRSTPSSSLLQPRPLSSRLGATTTQIAHISYSPDPAAPPPANPNAARKVPQSARPLARPTTPPPTITAEALHNAPYIVRRTPFAQLPIYRKWKAGGNKQIIYVKKINGDRKLLAQELIEKLEVEPANVRINPTTGHLEIKVC